MVRVPDERLREAVRRSGYTYEALAAAVRAAAAEAGTELHTNPSAVAHWIKGTRPLEGTARLITAVLSRRLGESLAPADLGLADPDEHGLPLDPDGDPVAHLACIGRHDMERRSLIAAAGYSAAAASLPLAVLESRPSGAGSLAAPRGRAAAEDVDAVEEMTAYLTDLDERRGGQHGRQAAVAYFTGEVLPLCRAGFPRPADRARALQAAASLAYLLAWKASDAGENGRAQQYHLQALRMTRDSGSDLHSAFILYGMSRLGMDLNRPEHTLSMAEHGARLVAGKADPGTEALFIVRHAQALAHDGQRTRALRRADEARAMADRCHLDERVPGWSALWRPPAATVATNTAQVLAKAGDLRGAEAFYQRAAAVPHDAEHHRINGLTLLSQAGLQARQERIEEACATSCAGIEQLREVKSRRAVKAVTEIRSALAPYAARGVQAAADVERMAQQWQEPGV